MPRLVHAVTGSVVNVPDSLAADLGGEWRPLDAPDPAPDPAPETAPEPEAEVEAEQAAEPEPGPGAAPKKPARAAKK